MKPRPKYKALYEAEKDRNRSLHDKLGYVQQEHDRMRAVLVDHCERVVLPRLKNCSDGLGEPIVLEPLDFVAYEQTLSAMTRFVADAHAQLGPRLLSFRARRVMQSREVKL